jgi:hypothetical protein
MELGHYRVQRLALVTAVLDLGLYYHSGNDYALTIQSAKRLVLLDDGGFGSRQGQ